MAGNATAAPNVVSKYEQRLNEKMADYISIKDVIEAISNQYGIPIPKAIEILAKALEYEQDSWGINGLVPDNGNLVSFYEKSVTGPEEVSDSDSILKGLINTYRDTSEGFNVIPF